MTSEPLWNKLTNTLTAQGIGRNDRRKVQPFLAIRAQKEGRREGEESPSITSADERGEMISQGPHTDRNHTGNPTGRFHLRDWQLGLERWFRG